MDSRCISDKEINIKRTFSVQLGFSGSAMVKNLPTNAGDVTDEDSTPRSRRYSAEGNGNSPQYSCLGNPMDRVTWQAMVQGIEKSQTRLRTELACMVIVQRHSYQADIPRA